MQHAEAVRLPESGDPAGVQITPEKIKAYLETLSGRGRSRETVQMYGAKLRTFYSYLPQDKQVGPDTLAAWRSALLEAGYSPSTVNTHLSAANGLLEHLGRRDLQLVGRLASEPTVQPELTRAEYLRLLQAARALEKERAYLLVKVFALLGIRVGELPQVTVEQVKAGRLLLRGSGVRQYVPIPASLRGELLDYVRRQGLRTGESVPFAPVGRPARGKTAQFRRPQFFGKTDASCRRPRGGRCRLLWGRVPVQFFVKT